MFFEKKYLKKKEEYLKEIINSMNENGFKNPDFYLKDGALFLINRENGVITYIAPLSIPCKKDLLNRYSFLYNLELMKEKIVEVKNEINRR